MGLVKKIKDINSSIKKFYLDHKQQINAVLWLLLSVLFLFMPILIGQVLTFVKFKSEPAGRRVFSLRDEIMKGEMIFAALSLLTPIIYTVKKIVEDNKKKKNASIQKIIVFMIFAAVVWTLLYCINFFGGELPFALVLVASIVTFLYGLYLAYKVKVTEIEEQVTAETIEEERQEREAKISTEMDNIRNREEGSTYLYKGDSAAEGDFIYNEEDDK